MMNCGTIFITILIFITKFVTQWHKIWREIRSINSMNFLRFSLGSNDVYNTVISFILGFSNHQSTNVISLSLNIVAAASKKTNLFHIRTSKVLTKRIRPALRGLINTLVVPKLRYLKSALPKRGCWADLFELVQKS